MLEESLTTPKYWILWVGTNTDLSGCKMNPNEGTGAQSLTLSVCCLAEAPISARESSKKDVDICDLFP